MCRTASWVINNYASIINTVALHGTLRGVHPIPLPSESSVAVVVAAKRAARRDGVRVFKRSSWLEPGSVKAALSPLLRTRLIERHNAWKYAYNERSRGA